jgi:hypothetical protein
VGSFAKKAAGSVYGLGKRAVQSEAASSIYTFARELGKEAFSEGVKAGTKDAMKAFVEGESISNSLKAGKDSLISKATGSAIEGLDSKTHGSINEITGLDVGAGTIIKNRYL